MTTPSKLSGSGPKKEVKAPCCPIVTGISLGISDSLKTACIKPPCPFNTDAMTATMPTSITIPCTKSLMAVAM